MIRINLLPAEFRIKEVKSKKADHIKIALGMGVLTVLITLYFFFDYLSASAKLKQINKRWKEIQPQFDQLTTLQKEVDGPLKAEREFIERFVTTHRPLTHLLQWASELLPDTAWLIELRLTRAKGQVDFLVKGNGLPAKGKTSIEQINTFLQQLKSKLGDAKLSLQTTRQEISKVEMTQFTADFIWEAGGGSAP